MTMRTWNHPPARPRPPGQWDDEPDKAVWVDEPTGLDCMVHRAPGGHLCGYVGVGPDHPWHGNGYDDLDVDVHGGLTYAAPCQTGDDITEAHGICHVPEDGRPHDVWWLGFDCAHLYDLSPSTLRYDPTPVADEQYRDFAYVQREVTRLAAQVAGAEA